MVKIELDGKTTMEKNVDGAMWKIFNKYPDASFSDWNETQAEEWLNIIVNNKIIGRIIDDGT
jgi:hypothetical protein